MSKYNIMIFDLDGTLSNSKEGITKSVQYALKSVGIEEENLDSLEHFIGPPLIDEFVRSYGMTVEEAAHLKEVYRERYLPIGIYETTIYPGTKEMLSTLKKAGKKLAIATSKPLEMAIEVLKYLEIYEYFDYVMGAETKGNRQSKEAVLNVLIEESGLHINNDNAVMIGDTCFDVDGAKKVGLDTIGVSYGFGNSKEMLEHGAIAIVDSAKELEEYLLSWWIEDGMKEKVTARNLWRGIYPILFFQGTAIVIQNILMITLSVMSANSKYTGISQYSDRVNKINSHAMEITLLTDIICIIIMAYFMYSDRVKDKLKGIYVKYEKVKWTKYLLVIPFAYFFMMSANALVSILTLYMPESMVGTYDNTKEILNNSSYFMLIITTAIIAPISEEFMHRGVVYNRFKRICPPVLAAIISSIIFGIIHMNFVQGPYAFLVGLAAVYVYERYKSIIAPIILHVTANSVSTIVSIIANETGLDTSAASQYNTVQLTASYLQMAIVFGILALIIGIIIYKTVIPNEIKEIK